MALLRWISLQFELHFTRFTSVAVHLVQSQREYKCLSLLALLLFVNDKQTNIGTKNSKKENISK